MNIVIVGCGKVGFTLASQLVDEGHNITVIDCSAEHLEVAQALDVQVLVGNGTSFRVQQEAQIESADLLIAVTDQDEINLLSCLIAKKASQCQTVARVRSPQYYEEIDYIRQCMGTNLIINPEYASAMEIDHLIRIPSAMEVDTFAKGRVELLKLEIPEKSVLDGMKVPDLSKKFDKKILVCILEREKDYIIPNGETVLKSGDQMYVILPPGLVTHFCRVVGLPVKPLTNVMIAGGGTISYYLAQRLLRNGISVKIIEKNEARCEFLSEALPEANVIYGDATDHSMLLEEGLTQTDAFVAMTSIDEENVFLSLYANKVAPQAKKITKNSHLDLNEISVSLPVGSLVSPKAITAEYISQYVRSQQYENKAGSTLKAVYRLAEGQVEALEFHITEDSGMLGIPLADLPMKSGLLLCCIVRGKQIITPGGRDTMEKGDIVIVVTVHKNLTDIRDFLIHPV